MDQSTGLFVRAQSTKRPKFFFKKSLIVLFFFVCVSLFNGISTFMSYLIPKSSLRKYYLIYSWRNKRFHTFPKGISAKVNVIKRLAFELTYYDVAVQQVKHYVVTGTPLIFGFVLWKNILTLWLPALLFVWVLWHINLCSLFNAKSIFIQIKFSISNSSV